MVTDALPHLLTGLWGSQARKMEIKIVSSWLRGIEFIKVNGKSNDAMTKMSLYVGKLVESSTASGCSCIVRCNHILTFMASLLEAMEDVIAFLLSIDVGSNRISSPSLRGAQDTRRKGH